jgi:hypothetical protein
VRDIRKAMLYGVVLPMLGNMCEASVQLYTLGLEETRNAPDSRDRVVVRSAKSGHTTLAYW